MEGLVRDKPARVFNQSAVERKSHFLPGSLSDRLITFFFSSEIAISFSPCFRHAKLRESMRAVGRVKPCLKPFLFKVALGTCSFLLVYVVQHPMSHDAAEIKLALLQEAAYECDCAFMCVHAFTDPSEYE